MGFRTHCILLCAVVLFGASTAQAVDFNGTGTGAIPDNNPTGITISFNAASFTQQVGDVRLQLTMAHTYTRDLKATLTSPSGTARLLIFGRTGLRIAAGGGSANLSGTYTFSDVGRDFWATVAPLGNDAVVPPGTYRTSTQGAGSPTTSTNNAGGCYTSLGGAFLGLAAADASGTWTLNIADLQSTDTGSVSAAVLTLLPVPDLIARSGFEVAPRGTCKPSSLDYTGIGRSSYVLIRNTGGGPNGALTWYIKENDLAGAGIESEFLHGLASDLRVSGDWDGDGITDAGVWRPGAPTGLYIIRLSSRPTRPFTLPFGQPGDDPTIVDDFNGDGLTDFAVYRAGAMSGDVSRTLIKLSSSFIDRNFTTGLNGYFPMSGDFNGDGAADIGVQYNAGSGNASFQLFNGLDGTSLRDPVMFGTPTDVIIDGNFGGSAIDDITVVRGVAGNILWSTLAFPAPAPTMPPTPVTPTTTATLGVSATDFPLFGDYDGDGLDDYATWRPSATVGQSRFTVRYSSAPATPVEVLFGANGDYPIGNTRAH